MIIKKKALFLSGFFQEITTKDYNCDAENQRKVAS